MENSVRLASTGQAPVVDLVAATPARSSPGSQAGLARLAAAKFNGGILRPGDTVTVRIFDTSEQGLVSTASATSLDLGSFKVDNGGFIDVPYAGRLRAAGSTPSALQGRIASGLKGSSISPEATVFVSETGSSGFTVNGAVNQAGRFNLTTQGERVLDAIALAGGPSSPSGETEVTVIRGRDRASASMDRLLLDQAQNIFVQPGDQIFLGRDATSFTSFGAFASPGEFRFQPGELTLAQAVARSGGLLNDRANARRVYLLRSEPADVARNLGVLPPGDPTTGLVPIIYRIDMKQPASLFAMQNFPMRKGDILYVPDSAGADIRRALNPFQAAQQQTTAAPPQ
ncbi:polysaccharide biosynthesis/export family protein [Aureimonas jatrophae]|uniref:polysaccharide biosynthesis/export family protein n=1 Tax=Aureimonas jatrophae TaxID=1166073 RepID=UPI001480876F|nr:polysaccharide biosynthesis/export family protein [Aureimonas jatrophae]MBB3953014.1 polysaccharide export outer membrane protein [Aureimonas jatrophae]